MVLLWERSVIVGSYRVRLASFKIVVGLARITAGCVYGSSRLPHYKFMGEANLWTHVVLQSFGKNLSSTPLKEGR